MKKVFPILITISLALVMLSFKNDNVLIYKNNNTGGEKDSIKGFRSLLTNDINANNTTVIFELNGKIVSFVDEFVKKQGYNLEKMKVWGEPYFVIFDRIFSSNALPIELKYLSVVESNLQSRAASLAGAVGPWQLMPGEAKRFGLKVSKGNDERTNVYKSTEAAAKVLKELYEEYNDWLLVIAAYNCGKGGVNKAISKSGSRNFYELQMYLPEQTRNHVKKYIATHYFFEGGGGWTTLTAKEAKEKKETLAYLLSTSDTINTANSVSFDITGKYNAVVTAHLLMMDEAQFNAFNPYFDKALAEGKTYTIKLPQDKMDLFKAKRQQILYESVQLMLSVTKPEIINTATVIK